MLLHLLQVILLNTIPNIYIKIRKCNKLISITDRYYKKINTIKCTYVNIKHNYFNFYNWHEGIKEFNHRVDCNLHHDMIMINGHIKKELLVKFDYSSEQFNSILRCYLINNSLHKNEVNVTSFQGNNPYFPKFFILAKYKNKGNKDDFIYNNNKYYIYNNKSIVKKVCEYSNKFPQEYIKIKNLKNIKNKILNY